MAIVDNLDTQIHTKKYKFSVHYSKNIQTLYSPKLKDVKTTDTSHSAYRHNFGKINHFAIHDVSPNIYQSTILNYIVGNGVAEKTQLH